MRKELPRFVALLSVCILACPLLAVGEAQKNISLPEPRMDGGKPLMQALKDRKSTKELSDKKIPQEVLSDLLWAAWGVNRPEDGKRTAPSAKNKQEIDLYLLTAEGVYVYDATAHQLKQVFAEDHRKKAGGQAYVGVAPLELVYVADFAKSAGSEQDDRNLYADIATGCIIQNVYLFCASEGLGTVTHVASRGPELSQSLDLREDQRVIMAQSVGYGTP
jgi:nitroreductase